MTADVVFLVEDRTKGSERMTYWSKVYLSPAKARAGVEHWARQDDVGSLRWEDNLGAPLGVATAYTASGAPAYTIVPLGVQRDDQPEQP